MAHTKIEGEAVSSALCSSLHELRTVGNSGKYFLPRLNSLKEANPKLKLLDVGCGWGHMTASLAKAVGPEGHVVGLDINEDTLALAPEVAKRADVADQVEFIHGDAYKLPFPDATFDMVHCHQVLCHMEKPWDAICEMARVTKPGGIVAIREGDLDSEIVWPQEPGLAKFHKLIATAMNARGRGGGGADSGRQLLPWTLNAGLKRSQITVSYGTWWFDTPEDKDRWAKAMAAQVRGGMVGEIAKKTGLASGNDLEEMASAWEDWATREDSSLAMIHGEVVIEK